MGCLRLRTLYVLRTALPASSDVSAGLPPLSDEARTALSACADGHDHNEEAFAYLVGAVRDWTPAALATARGQPLPAEQLIAGRDDARGLVVEVIGILAQRDRLEDFWEDVEEWYIRLPDGGAVCVFVVDPPATPRGSDVRLVGLSYKRVDATGRDGQPRSYPAVVARVAAIESMTARATRGAVPLIGLVIAMLGALVFLRWRVAKLARPRVAKEIPSDRFDAPDELPQDPAEALAALRRRNST